MKKIIMICICLFLISGCIDRTNEICGVFKHSPNYQNFTIKMEDGICVISKQNYTHVYFLHCKSITERGSIIIKTDIKKDFDEMPRWCEIEEI